MLPTSPMRAQRVPAPVMVPVSAAPPVAAGFSRTTLHADPVQVPSEKATTTVLSVPIDFKVAVTAPLVVVEKLWIAEPLCATVPVNVSVTGTAGGVGVVGASSSQPAATPARSRIATNRPLSPRTIVRSLFLFVHYFFEAAARPAKADPTLRRANEIDHVLHFGTVQRRVLLDLRQRPAGVRVEQVAIGAPQLGEDRKSVV